MININEFMININELNPILESLLSDDDAAAVIDKIRESEEQKDIAIGLVDRGLVHVKEEG